MGDISLSVTTELPQLRTIKRSLPMNVHSLLGTGSQVILVASYSSLSTEAFRSPATSRFYGVEDL